MPESQDVYAAASRAKEWLSEHGRHTQIAFFGGSFTAIDRGYMMSLLRAAKDVVRAYGLEGIRISTRPDKIDAEIMSLLKRSGVTAIELGAQSMCDEVLKANDRGHLAEHVERAAFLVAQQGFELGLQMMTGLYMDTPERSFETAKKLIALKPQTVRIYPALVLKETRLEELMHDGFYAPQTLDEAVELCGELIVMFESANIKVIRVGLHDEPSLKGGLVAGPYHPAFRELCLSRIFLNSLLPKLNLKLAQTGELKYNIKINPKTLSIAVGQKRCNIQRLREQGFEVQMKPDPAVAEGEFIIKGLMPNCN